LGRPPNKPRTPHRTDTEQSPDAHRTRRAFWLCAFRCAEGARDGVLARPAFPAVLMTPIFQSHFFLAGSEAQRRGLTRLPRSVHSPAKKGEIIASRRRWFFLAAVSSGPPAATWRRVRASLR